jgi:sulfite reductase (NADPH) hemoprotein beta-component
VEELSEEQHVVFVLATAGQGEDCANAKHLTADLLKSTSSLRGVNYAVFGLGDSHYWGEGSTDSAKYFCKPAIDLDAKLTALGATKLVDVGLGDDQDDDGYSGALGVFESALWNKMDVTVVESLEGMGVMIIYMICMYVCM